MECILSYNQNINKVMYLFDINNEIRILLKMVEVFLDLIMQENCRL